MSNEIWYKDAYYSCRWLGYFDILGTSALIKSQDQFYVFTAYAKAIETAISISKPNPNVNSVWFSDSFLIYTPDDSAQNFTLIDQVSRWFVYFLIEASIPVRGAISCGDFYADRSNSLYFGSALVEAYEYGEAQEWIGFLISPSAEKRLDTVGLPVRERLNYAYWNVPFKTGREKLISNLPACILGQWNPTNDENRCLEKMRKLKSSIQDKHIVKKYDNAIRFIEKCQRSMVNKG